MHAILLNFTYYLFLGFVCVFIQINETASKTITIPGDAISIQEAVDLAVSGDEILLATDFVDWNPIIVESEWGIYESHDTVYIRNKNLIIRGNLENSKTDIGRYVMGFTREEGRTLHITNSDVKIQNCNMIPISARVIEPSAVFHPGASPIEIESGSLRLENCHYTSQIISKAQLQIIDCVIENAAYRSSSSYGGGKGGFPTIEINNSLSSKLEIINSTITSDNRSSINNLHIMDSTNTVIHIENSNLYGGNGNLTGGTEGLLINNCNSFEFILNGSRIIGKNAQEISRGRFGVILGGGSGGNGITVSNSIGKIYIEKSLNIIEGNNGSHGYVGYGAFLSETEINAGNGGHGLAILNSDIKVNFATFEDAFLATGGKGGDGAELDGRIALPGEDGLPIYIDENSTIIYETSIENWMVH